jgi:predicted nucleic acid-binding protein
MLVADSSAVIEALIGAGATTLRERLRVPLIHAPALIDYEVMNVLRRSVQLREIGIDRTRPSSP